MDLNWEDLIDMDGHGESAKSLHEKESATAEYCGRCGLSRANNVFDSLLSPSDQKCRCGRLPAGIDDFPLINLEGYLVFKFESVPITPRESMFMHRSDSSLFQSAGGGSIASRVDEKQVGTSMIDGGDNSKRLLFDIASPQYGGNQIDFGTELNSKAHDFNGSRPKPDGLIDNSSERMVYFQNLDQVFNCTGLSHSLRPEGKTLDTKFWNNILFRNFGFLECFLDPVRFEATEKSVKVEYAQFCARFRFNKKNKHREFWTQRVEPLLKLLGSDFKRVSMVGSLKTLTPAGTKRFYALLCYMAESSDKEAASIMNACWVVAGICEHDPNCQVFPKYYSG
jgi:hypothetical protein